MREAHKLGGRLVDDLILEETDGELGDADLTLLRAHLGECAVCRGLRASYQRTQQRISGLVPDRDEIVRARTESLRRIRVASAEPKGRIWRGALFALPTAAAVLIAVVLGVMFVRTNVASPSYPDSEVVAEAEFAIPGGRAMFSVVQGSRFALPGDAIGVLARVDLRFDRPQSGGLAEIRLREPGDAHGILARAPDLSGATRQTLEGRVPNVDPGATRSIELWLHLEGPDFDSQPIILELTYATGGGVRATVAGGP